MATKSYLQLQQELVALTAKVEEAKAAEIAAFIEETKQKIREYGLSPKDLGFKMSSKGTAKDATVSIPAAPKYRNAKTGETWSGRGPRPQWFRDALEKGQKAERFLIDQ
ncbi:H-NS histone family protein [Paraburkholderia sp. UCT31]|uniref:H-NS histone family protein n=1 Tax=Paraburkholderia sp. UCT31 TaxID=2615209 RepID=UPI00165515CC|nr:H-NS histone family protein [Paraburkholderia sp. UCT31]MBC8737076.1 H-NS histone family protein [Paraburkholderia sp. UCT31]